MSAGATAVVLGAAALECGWLAAAHLVRRATRPAAVEPGAAPGAPGDEPAAVVNLLVSGGEVTTEAVPATVLDLAGRDVLTIVEVGPDQDVVELRPKSELPKGLRPYERQVLDHLRKRAKRGVVPPRAVASLPSAVDGRWHRRFERSVAAEARRRRLARPRYPLPLLLALAVGLVAIGLIVLGVLVRSPEGDGSRPAWWAMGAAVVAGVVCVRTMTTIDRHQVRLTGLGRQTAAGWIGVRSLITGAGYELAVPAAARVLHPDLSRAAAMGLAPTAVARLPLGAEDEHHAWSAADGHWRPVEVRYPSWHWWGRSPWRAVTVGAAWAAVLLVPLVATRVMGSDLYRWAFELLEPLADPTDAASPLGPTGHHRAALLTALGVGAALTGLGVLGVWRGAVPLVLGLSDLPVRRRRQGTVVRARRLARADRDDVVVDAYVAVDEGREREVTAWRVRPALIGALQQGNVVAVEVTPRLGFVRSARVIAAWEPVVAPPTEQPVDVNLLFDPATPPEWTG